MKKNFVSQLNAVVAEAIKFITEAANKQNKIVLLDKENIYDDDEEETEEFLEMPTITHVTKHGFYEQYAVLSIEKKGDDIILNTKGRGEADEYEDFVLSEVSMDDMSNICYIADLIANKV